MGIPENPIPFERPNSDIFDSVQGRYITFIEQGPLTLDSQEKLNVINGLPEADKQDRIALELWHVGEYFTESCGTGPEYREHLRLKARLEQMRGGTIYESK